MAGQTGDFIAEIVVIVRNEGTKIGGNLGLDTGHFGSSLRGLNEPAF
jgi:hypothetical protein